MGFYMFLIAGLLLVTIVQSNDRWDTWWNYKAGFSGPASWGGVNPNWRMCSEGHRQSPIDIIPSDLLYDGNLKHVNVGKRKVEGVLRNTGHDIAVDIESPATELLLTDGPLSYQYRVDKIVIHFGSKDEQGSEHKIEGKPFPAEVQIWAYNSELYANASVAYNSNYGLAAISLLVGINDSISSGLGNLINEVAHVQYRGEVKTLSKFSVHDLLPATHSYITYEGSMTKPACLEIVTWIIMNKPVYITPDQMALLRQTVSTEQGSAIKSPLQDNYRPVQGLNRRAIRTNINFPQQKSSVCDFKREKTYTANQQILSSLYTDL